jgi:transcriptional regulator with XRE-family HTH domain
MDIAKSLRRARKQRGLTQHRLASLTGVPRINIARLELGLGDPRISTLIKLGKAMRVSVVRLIK